MEEIQDKLQPVKLFFISSTPAGCNEELAPIIFIPGLFSNNRTFSAVRYKISKRTKRKIYAIDLRNHGKSEFSNKFSIPHLVADLENFMESENIPKAILAAHSMGGRVAMSMALKNPDKIEKLIVEDIPIVSTEQQDEELMKIFTLAQYLHKIIAGLPSTMSLKQAQEKLIPFVAKVWPIMVENFSAANSRFTLPIQKDDVTGEFKWEMNIDVVLETQHHLQRLEMDLSGDPVYDGELLLVTGGKSVVRVQDNLDDYHKHFPKFKCRTIENGFHSCHVEVPEVYTKIVSQFIGEEEL